MIRRRRDDLGLTYHWIVTGAKSNLCLIGCNTVYSLPKMKQTDAEMEACR